MLVTLDARQPTHACPCMFSFTGSELKRDMMWAHMHPWGRGRSSQLGRGRHPQQFAHPRGRGRSPQQTVRVAQAERPESSLLLPPPEEPSMSDDTFNQVRSRAVREPGNKFCKSCHLVYNLAELLQVPPTRMRCANPGCKYLVHPSILASYSYCCRECHCSHCGTKANTISLPYCQAQGSPPHGECCVRRQQQDVEQPVLKTWKRCEKENR